MQDLCSHTYCATEETKCKLEIKLSWQDLVQVAVSLKYKSLPPSEERRQK